MPTVKNSLGVEGAIYVLSQFGNSSAGTIELDGGILMAAASSISSVGRPSFRINGGFDKTDEAGGSIQNRRNTSYSAPLVEAFQPLAANRQAGAVQLDLTTSGYAAMIPIPNVTTPSYIGMQPLTLTGTASAGSIVGFTGPGDYLVEINRLAAAVTTPSTTAVVGFRSPASTHANSRNVRDFTCIFGFGLGAASSATRRAFVGFRGTAAAPTDANPSAQTNCFGFGCDSGDTTWQYMVNDASGTCTKINTGISKAYTTDGEFVYVAKLHNYLNYEYASLYKVRTSSMQIEEYWEADVSTQFQANLPNVAVGFDARASVGGTSSAISLAICGLSWLNSSMEVGALRNTAQEY